MTVYLGRDRQRIAQNLTVTRATVSELTEKIEGRGYNLYKDNCFSSPEFFDDSELMAQVNRLEQPSTKFGHSLLVTAT
jgi:hypothetical protein